MKKRLFIQTCILLFVVMRVMAYDIKAENSDGMILYYDLINDDKELKLTQCGEHNLYSGDVVIPEEVTYKNITRKVTEIDGSAFSQCINLNSVVIPPSVKYIWYGAFMESSIVSVTIPESVTLIDEAVFWECTSLKTITLPSGITKIPASLFSGCCSLTSIIIPNNVTEIGHGAFYGCTSLTSIEIPNSVTTIGIQAFSNCSALSSVTIPNSVTDIDLACFEDCKSLKNIDLPNSITNIKDYTFKNCSSLTSVVIPNSVTEIGEQAFLGCLQLKTVSLPNSITIIKNNTFQDCRKLTSITIPNTVTTIGVAAFAHCRELPSITIPNRVTTLGKSAFNECISLKSITIPNSVTSIGNYVFAGCELNTVISQIEDPFAIERNTFAENIYKNAELYVPAGTIDKYKDIYWWKFFSNIKEGSPSSINSIESVLTNYVKRYTIDGRLIKKAHKGINIIKEKNGKTRKVIDK